MTWVPQRVVNIALIVSALSLLLCLFLIAVPGRFLIRRRRRTRAAPRHALGATRANNEEERDEAMIAGAASGSLT